MGDRNNYITHQGNATCIIECDQPEYDNAIGDLYLLVGLMKKTRSLPSSPEARLQA